jgi:hypothetical protein
MMTGIQMVGLIFALFMMYLTFLYHKRGNYRRVDFGVWMIIWLSFTAVVMFPEPLDALLNPLKVVRLLDLFTIFALMAVFCMLFFLHLTNRRNEEKINRIVRKLALEGGKGIE